MSQEQESAKPAEPSVRESWKEIAHHFDVTVRTVQMWEAERGLPVHRKAGPKGRVFAFCDELDVWAAQHVADRAPDSVDAGEPPDADADATETEPPVSPTPLPPGNRMVNARVARWLTAAAMLLLVISLGAWAMREGTRGDLVAVEADRIALRGLDINGNTLWTHPWPQPFVNAYSLTADPLRPLVQDLDGDGASEVYVWFEPEASEGRPQATSVLYAFDSRGNVRWQFAADSTLATASHSYPPPYSGRALRQIRYDGGRQRGLLAIANHGMYYPARVMLLSRDGELLREYQHSGHLHSLLVDDLDGDGRDEVCFLGISNSYDAVDFTVLDPDHMGGASAEPGRMQLVAAGSQTPDPPRGERLRVVLPRTAISLAVEPYPATGLLRREGDGILATTIEGQIHTASPHAVMFRFDGALRLQDAGVSDNFRQAWELHRRSGKLTREIADNEFDSLRQLRVLQAATDPLIADAQRP